jgi:hypothetical protein
VRTLGLLRAKSLADESGNDFPERLFLRRGDAARRAKHVIVQIQCRSHLSRISNPTDDVKMF